MVDNYHEQIVQVTATVVQAYIHHVQAVADAPVLRLDFADHHIYLCQNAELHAPWHDLASVGLRGLQVLVEYSSVD